MSEIISLHSKVDVTNYAPHVRPGRAIFCSDIFGMIGTEQPYIEILAYLPIVLMQFVPLVSNDKE